MIIQVDWGNRNANDTAWQKIKDDVKELERQGGVELWYPGQQNIFV